MTRGRWIFLLLGTVVFGACVWLFQILLQGQCPPAALPGARSTSPWFVDVTDQVGLRFIHDAGPVGDYFMPQQVGSGVALFDFDNDGRLDLLLLQNGGPKSASTNRLFRQLADGTLSDVSKGSGLDFNGHNMGVAVGDINNDGWLDLAITQYLGVKLFINQKNGVFEDVSEAARVSNPSWGTSAAFFDYDRDGWLDLIVVCYVDYDPTWPCAGPGGKRDYCAPKTFKGRVSRLFRNLGASPVRFEDVTVKSGLGQAPGPGLGVLCADFDGDGWPDIFIANDGAPNHLWMNQKDGTFKEEALRRGIAYNENAVAQAGMGIAHGDIDGDGLFDIFVTHLAEETHTLWRQGPAGLYQEKTNQFGLLKSHWRGTGFGALFADFNHDGRLDLPIVNGAVAASSAVRDRSLGPFWSDYGQRNQIFTHDGSSFRDISLDNPAFCEKLNVARALARGDLDGDGALDLIVTTIAGPARIFRNVAAQGHWLSVRAFDPALGRDMLGSEVHVIAGSQRWIRWLHPAESYLASSEPRAHFGLGDHASVSRIEIRWPDGVWEEFAGRPTNQRVEVRKGEGKRRGP